MKQYPRDWKRAVSALSAVTGLAVFFGPGWPSLAESDVAKAPEAHLVKGLEPGDVLNVRAAPSAASEDLGDLEEDGQLFDILERDSSGKWARIHWGERDAWVAARYLAPVVRETVPETDIPIGLRCGGTEPFWSVSVVDADKLKLDIVGIMMDRGLKLQHKVTSVNYLSYPAALIAKAEDVSASLLIRPGRCSDGMSDLTYGWQSDLLLNSSEQPVLMSGCCRMLPE